MAFEKGDTVDRYRLDERLGAGAFGEVWKASQLADNQDVGLTCAVKIMKLAQDGAGSSGSSIASGWLDEVRNLVRVAGETIPRILEANVWKGHAYIAMELLAGSTLAARLSQGPIPWRRALFIADQMAKALEDAHEVGVVHRDLKPQNVILVGPRRVCVVDWGIARLNASTTSSAPSVVRRATADVDATDAGPVDPITTPIQRPSPIGTPGYMAPEVYEGEPPAPAQDVFALGIVLYEMLSGSLPHDIHRFDRTSNNPDSVKAYRTSLEKATVDYSLMALEERCPDLPSGVLRLVDSLLARESKDRPTHLRKAIATANRFPHGVPTPPYTGLVKIGPERAGLYFGQQDAIDHVLEKLTDQRAVLLWGPSGSGKSSLALAGVAATMDRTLFRDTDGWTIHVVRPREGRILRVAQGDEPAKGGNLGHVVVIDQLEEVVDLDSKDRDAFCVAVLALLDASGSVVVRDTLIRPTDEVRVVATIRDDLEWRADREVPALRPLLERRIIVKGVDANFARSIIEEPARALGYQVEDVEAVSREVAERLSADAAKLPVVQYALSEWWERRDEGKKLLPAAAWKELGGVDGALSFVAERFYASLAPEQQERARALFARLFTGGRKQPVLLSKLADTDQPLMEELVRLRLVGRRERKGGAPFFEVEHESLAANWSRLAGWLAEEREDRALADELERDADAWARDGNKERLWRKGRLAVGREVTKRQRIDLSASATDFLAQSRRVERRGRVALMSSLGVAAAIVMGGLYGEGFWLRSQARKERAELSAELQRAKQDKDTLDSKNRELDTQLTNVQQDRQDLKDKIEQEQKFAKDQQKAAEILRAKDVEDCKKSALHDKVLMQSICGY